ncbi:MAG: bL17 family ribosomal protein [Pirellulaceae bacterium]
MRHRRQGRTLGRSPSHRKALFRNMVTALVLTERENTELDDNAPKVKGRITTTIAKAKEIRPLVEKCVTIAKKGLVAERAAEQFACDDDRGTEAWKSWRNSDKHAQWVAAITPSVNARRRLYQILGSKEAVQILMDVLAERYEDRPGGYTRIMRLATPRLGDAGVRAILEFVGKNDRVAKKSEKPDFGGADDSAESAEAEGAGDDEAVADAKSEADGTETEKKDD